MKPSRSLRSLARPLRRSCPFVFILLAACLLCTNLPAQYNTPPISADTLQQRLKLYRGNDTQREAALKKLFVQAGCFPANLFEQTVPGRKQPNIICSLPGATPATILVGAHFDHANEGDGVIDNWSGASLLPSLFERLASAPRQHTFLFVGFTGEEAGLIGSSFYARQLNTDQRKHIEAMINLDTLALGPTKIWVSQSDPRLVNTIVATAKLMSLPIAGVDVNGVGESDEESFIAEKICTLTVHSLTPSTLHVLHRPDDNPSAIRLSDYFDTFRLLSSYLLALDTLRYPSEHVCTIKVVDNTPPFYLRRRRR